MNRFIPFFITLVLAVFSLIVPKSQRSIHINQLRRDQYLESSFTNIVDYESAFGKANGKSNIKAIAGITSHHFLAKDLIAEFFSGIDPKDIKHVFIVGPDHYGAITNKHDLVSSMLDWQTPYGILPSGKNLIGQLVKANDISDTTFKTEHSIYTLVPFVKRSLPTASVIPLVLRYSNDYEKYFELGKIFSTPNSFLIVSTDFSHETTKGRAWDNDKKSIQMLKGMNISDIGNIECDCKQCIAFLYGFISKGPASHFALLDNNTSADFGSQEKDNLTSYVSGYFVPSE